MGTIASLWQANMDLLGENPEFDVGDKTWKMHSRNPLAPPEYVGKNGIVKNSILGSNVIVEEGAIVKDAVVLANSIVKKDAKVSYSIIDENVTVGENAVIGVNKDPNVEIVVLGRDIKVGNGVRVENGQKYEKDILV